MPKYKPTDRPLPTKMRFIKLGVLQFKPDAIQRAKIALGFPFQVHIQMAMQHNPGVVEVASSLKITEHDDKTLPTVADMTPIDVNIQPAKPGEL